MEISAEDVLLFVKELNEFSAYDLTDYSDKSITRRIEKIVNDNNMGVADIIERMKKSSDFLEKIVRDITVNTTEMFRDPKVWHTLRYTVLPRYKDADKLSIWHAGCSSGQELYSMLILLNEMNLFEKTEITGTDINIQMLEEARKAVYKYRFNLDYLDNFNKVIRENPFNLEEYYDVPYEKYMNINKAQDTISILPFLTRKPEFHKHDLVKDGNIFGKKFDLIICRNVLIYFNSRLQNRVFDLFHKSLNDDGCLVIGLHESILGPVAEKYNKKGLVYLKKP